MPPKKSLRLTTKPGVQPQPPEKTADTWVENRNGSEETAAPSPKTKRITFEVTEAQHQATKIHATRKGMTIKELMQSLLEQELKQPE